MYTASYYRSLQTEINYNKNSLADCFPFLWVSLFDLQSLYTTQQKQKVIMVKNDFEIQFHYLPK